MAQCYNVAVLDPMRRLFCLPQGRCLCAAFLLWSLSFTDSLPIRRDPRSPQLRLLRRASNSTNSTNSTGNAPAYDFRKGRPPPRGHFTPQSGNVHDWPRERQKWRDRLLSSSRQFAADLEKYNVDDGKDDKDSYLWADLKEFSVPDTSEYWNDLCNGTNMSEDNKLPGDVAAVTLNMTEVLAAWKAESNTTCSEVGNEHNGSLEAFKKCGTMCDGLVDVGCERKTFKLCNTGSPRKPASGDAAGSCVLNKPADFADPKGMPRPPLELGFWKDFCKYRHKGRKLRIMFEGKKCEASAVKALDEAANPVECAGLAAKDAECSKVFDFRFGPPSVCRCLKVGEGCAPAVADGGHVYGPSGLE